MNTHKLNLNRLKNLDKNLDKPGKNLNKGLFLTSKP